MEFHDDYPQYEFMYHHTDEAGKVKRKKLWMVFWIMLVITLIELYVGFNATAWGLTGGAFLKIFFVVFTLVKAGYIVLKFMHLGDETKFFKYTILVPYIVFIVYLVFIVLVEGTYAGRVENRTKLWTGFEEQHYIKNVQHGRTFLYDTRGNVKPANADQIKVEAPAEHGGGEKH
jgi:cytochrome c oxidase subunit IV